MIKTKRDLEEYLLVDETANHFNKSFLGLFDLRKKFFRRLRKTEYLNNHCNGLFGKLHLNVSKFLLYRLTQKTGYEIPLNSFGKGLRIPHYGSIIVNSSSRFGDDCLLQSGVNISENCIGGNHIFFGAGSKILSNVKMGNDIIIGANAVVTKSFDNDNIVLAGVPAKKISDNGWKERVKI